MFTNPDLKKNAKYLNAFVVSDFVNEPIHIINAEGNIVFVNKSWCEVYKLKKHDALGKPIRELLEMVNPVSYYLSIDEDNSSNIKENFRLTYQHLDDCYKESSAIKALKEKKKISMLTDSPENNRMMVTSTPIFNEKNELIYVFTLVQNLTRMSDWKEKLESEIQKNKRITEELKYYRETQQISNLIGNSKKMREIKELITVVSKTDVTILITGESGVGKEVVAKAIYSNSLRKNSPFITINCAAIPENLLESEMFGYEKGAFTGAVKRKIGLFELADKGTLLLDEIGEIPLKLQPKLLRVLQEQEIMRVGGTIKIPIDVRIIAATNQDIFTLSQKGVFRQDLYYRLNVINMEIPPLRERKEDISLLALSFLSKFNKKYNKNKYFSEQTLYLLEQNQWIGNIRELENAVERMVIIGEVNTITPTQASFILSRDNNVIDLEINTECSLKDAVHALERKLIQEALDKYKTTYKAAEALKTTQPTIVRKAKMLGITKW